jgi:hypothetical protein
MSCVEYTVILNHKARHDMSANLAPVCYDHPRLNAHTAPLFASRSFVDFSTMLRFNFRVKRLVVEKWLIPNKDACKNLLRRPLSGQTAYSQCNVQTQATNPTVNFLYSTRQITRILFLEGQDRRHNASKAFLRLRHCPQ